MVDAALEASVVGSFSRVGPWVRRRLFDWEPLPRLDGKTVLLTGPTSGIGLAAAGRMVELGAELHLVGRSPERLEHTAAALRRRRPDAKVSIAAVVDLGELAQVREAAAEITSRLEHLDVLVHNAGALLAAHTTTGEGIETTVASHVLGPFLLTASLLPLLRRGQDARVVTVSSGGMYTERLDVDRLEMPADDYRGTVAYARAKRAQVVLNEQWAEREPTLHFHAMHPGWVDTPGVREALPGFRRVMGGVLRTPDEGADTIVWLAADPAGARSTGRFWLDRVARSTIHLPWTRPAKGESDRLWEWTVRRTGAAALLTG